MINPGVDSVLFLVPGDPDQRTGGYRYVSRLVGALNARGLNAGVQGLDGRFPIPDSVAKQAMDSALSHCEDGALIVLDGLAMGGLPELVEQHSARLNLVALVHHPLADETGISEDDKAFLFTSEVGALAAVSRVITTSQHTAERLKDFAVPSDIIQVIEPGSDTVSVPEKAGRPGSDNEPLKLLCVAGLSPRKAQHQLVEALTGLGHHGWHCTLVGSTERDPDYSRQLASQIQALALADRIDLAGELGDQALARHYANADLFVLPSLYEGYGMVIDEALAAGLPVITTNGGALASTGNRPGIRQYPAGSVDALREHLKVCFSDRQVVKDMADAVMGSSVSVRRWSDAAAEFEQALRPELETDTQETRDHSQFDQQWLSLREPADHRARNRELLGQVQSWLTQKQSKATANTPELLRIADLGSGAGSNGVYLSEVLPSNQHWTLLDQNPSLLAEARARLSPRVAALETKECTLDADNLSGLMPVQTHLITASALIDLMSAPWLDALAATAKARNAAVYIVLSYAGEFHLSPAHGDDDLIRSLVNEHQHGDKGSGSALGPDATEYLAKQLERMDYAVAVAPSPWILGEEEDEGESDRALQAALIKGWCEAALEQSPGEYSRIRQWQSSRLALAEQGELTVEVAHHDLFAWPLLPAPHD